MKTIKLCSIAMLLLFTIFSCTREELLEPKSSELSLQSQPLSTASAPLLTTSGCPDCVESFAGATSTAATNAVYTLSGTTLTHTGTTITTIAATTQTYNVGNVIVTVSHDADNVYFTLERNNATGGFGNIRFFSPAVIPVPSNGPGNVGVPNGTRKIQVVRSRASFSACSAVTFSFRVSGGGNASVAGEVVTSAALSYTLRDICPPKCNIQVGDYTTHSRGFWRNNDGQAFLIQHASALFPLTIGCESGKDTSFATPAEVKNYLEIKIANGTPNYLPHAGTLAAQVLSLLINVKADAAVADYSASAASFGSLVVEIDDADIVAHPSWASLQSWNGKTVAEVLEIAQSVVGTCSSEHGYSHINEIVTAINENFEDGLVNNGLLTCGK